MWYDCFDLFTGWRAAETACLVLNASIALSQGGGCMFPNAMVHWGMGGSCTQLE
jgi:hypothetical protein